MKETGKTAAIVFGFLAADLLWDALKFALGVGVVLGIIYLFTR